MFERFTAPARQVVVGAQVQATRRSDRSIGTEHLLLGLVDSGRPVSDVLAFHGVALNTVDQHLPEPGQIESPPPAVGRWRRRRAPRAELTSRHVPFTSRAKEALQDASEEAGRRSDTSIQDVHLALALVQADTGTASELVLELVDDVARLVIELEGHLDD